MPKKRKALKNGPSNSMTLRIYGIWAKEDNRIIYINLSQEDTEMEYDMEDYTDETHLLVCLDAKYDLSSLGT